MRNVNKYITPIMILFFLLHAFFGTLEYIGLYNKFVHKATILFATLFIILILVHAIFGIIFAIKGYKNINKTKTYYLKANKYFYIKTISGILMIIFIIFHIILFTLININFELAKPLNVPSLIINLLLYISIFIHLIVSIKPMMISLGIDNKIFKIILQSFFTLFFIYLIASNIIYFFEV